MDRSQKRMLALSQRTPLHTLLQHKSFDPSTNIYELGEGNIGIAFEISPYIYASDDVADRVLTILNKAIIPDGSMASFSLWAGNDIRDIMNKNTSERLKRFTTTGDAEVDDILSRLADDHINFISSRTDRPIEPLFKTQVRNTRCFFSLVLKRGKGSSRPISDDDLIEEIYSEVLQGLEACKMNPKPLNPDSLRILLGNIINWTDKPSWKNPDVSYDDRTPINHQICDIDTECIVQGATLRFNDKYCKVLSANSFPRFPNLSDSYSFLIPHNSRECVVKSNALMTTNIFFRRTKASKEEIKRKRKWATKQNVAPFNKWEPKLGDIARSFDLLFDSTVDGEDRPCDIMFSVALFGDSEESVKRQASSTISHFKSLKYDLKEELLISLPVFASMLPLNADPHERVVKTLGRFKPCTTIHASRIIPVCAEWKGIGSPVSTFIGKTGQVLPFNLFDNTTNYNGLLMAESGSGKSVTSNRMIADILAHGGRSIIIDQGYSYLNACELFKGTFITFNEDNCPNLNPFPLINDFENEIDMLVGMLAAMAKISSKSETGIFQAASLRRILTDVWNEKGHSTVVDDIAELAGKSDDKRISDLKMLLNSFTKNGEYGKYYYNDSDPIDFDSSRLIVLELDDLKDKAHLSSVVVLQLILMANNYIYKKSLKDDFSWTLFLIDEAWKFIAEGSGNSDENPILEFILTAYRQFRKSMASIMMVTQSLNDVYGHSAGAAIAENAGNRIFMGQKPASIAQMVDEKKIVMDQFWVDQLCEVSTEKGVFSELFFDTSVAKGVGRLILSPYSLLIFSTDGADRSAIRNQRKQGYTIHQAAIRVLQERGVHEYLAVDVGAPAATGEFSVFDHKEEAA
jgi:conjugal transfer ATP-binding protein TraC